jgi:ABC-2 type transport system permease protein
MSATANSAAGFQQASVATFHPTHPFWWSVRRELWEFRSIYLAPLGVAVLVLIGSLVSMAHTVRELRNAAALSPMQQDALVQRPYNYAAMFLMGISMIVAIVYCLETLQTERRDRSILFWKSLPLSDAMTVVSKASIPIVVLPLIVVVLTVVTNAVMLAINTTVLLASGMGPGLLWAHLPLGQMWMMQAYHMFVLHGLWFAPLYGWLLLASAWAKRLAFLWAAIPLVVVGVVERTVFNSVHFANWMWDRFSGAPASDAYPGSDMAAHSWAHLHAGQVLFSAGLWSGIVFAAVCLLLAVKVRRGRG